MLAQHQDTMAHKLWAVTLVALIAGQVGAAPQQVSVGLDSNGGGLFGSLFGRTTNSMNAGVNAARDMLNNGVHAAATGFTAGTNSANAAVGAGLEIGKQIVGAKNDFISAGANFFGGLFRKATDFARQAGNTAANVFHSVVDGVRGFADRVLSRVGYAGQTAGSVVGNIATTNGQAIGDVMDAARGVASGATNTVNGLVQGTASGLRTGISGAANAATGFGTTFARRMGFGKK